MALVYQHYRRDKKHTFYIGIGASKKRAKSKDGRNNFWNKIANKTDYDVIIMLDGLSSSDAKMWEIYLISLYGRRDTGEGNLVNLTAGGDGTLDVSEYTREKYRKSRSGHLNPMYGKKRPEMSERLKGHGNHMYGRKCPDQSERMRLKTGCLNSFYGKKHTKESLDKISIAKSKRSVLDTSTGILYHNTRFAADALGLDFYKLKRMLYGYSVNKTSLIFNN